MYTRICEARIWVLLRDGAPVVCSRKWELYDAEGKFLGGQVKLKDWALQNLPGVPENVPRVGRQGIKDLVAFDAYIAKIKATPEYVPEKKSVPEVKLKVEAPPVIKLQRPAVIRHEPSPEELELKRRLEEVRYIYDLIEKVAVSAGGVCSRLKNMMIITKMDDRGRDCRVIVKALPDNNDRPFTIEASKGSDGELGCRSLGRNRWLAKYLIAKVEAAAYEESRRLEMTDEQPYI